MHAPAPVITIDGPAGAGKGVISRSLARRLGYTLLESGVLYRALALASGSAGVALNDSQRLSDLAARLDVRFTADSGDRPRVQLNGGDVTCALRTEACGSAASRLASIPAVRTALLSLQRGFRRPPGLVAEGRDMGTVVFADANLKIFLTASLEERARRRYKQLMEQGVNANLNNLFRELAKRDERDATRPVAPLIPAKDAVAIDSTGQGIEEVLAKIMHFAGDIN
jgi:cytidylate kinase